MLIAGAFHAGGSKFNWEIESQWTQPRRKMAGVELGKSSVADAERPVRDFEAPEDGFRHISTAAMHEFHHALTHCSTGKRPWTVRALLDCEGIPDWKDVRDYNGFLNMMASKRVSRRSGRKRLIFTVIS